MRTSLIHVLVVFVSEAAPQDLTEPYALLVNEECRRHVAAADGCAADTSAQNSIDRFTLRIEEMRDMPGVRGPMRLLHNLFVDIFLNLLRLLASFAERRRNGTLAEMAPARAPEQPRAWPADLRPRESGWLEQRCPEGGWDGRTMRGSFERPEMQEPIVEAPCKTPVIEQPAALPLPRRVHVRKLQELSGPVRGCAQHVDDGGWPRLRRPGLSLPMAAGFVRVDSKKWVFGNVGKCVHFVTYYQRFRQKSWDQRGHCPFAGGALLSSVDGAQPGHLAWPMETVPRACTCT